MNPYWKAAVLAVAAIALAISFTHMETRNLPDSFDVCEADGSLERPILTFDYIRSMCMCTRPGKRGMSYTLLSGVYERPGISRPAAVLVGLAVPLVLLVMAAIVAGRTLRGALRIICGVVSVTLGGLTFAVASLQMYGVLADTSRYRWILHLWLDDPFTPRDVLTWLLAGLTLAGGVALLFRRDAERHQST